MIGKLAGEGFETIGFNRDLERFKYSVDSLIVNFEFCGLKWEHELESLSSHIHVFLAHRIRISEISHWDRKSYRTHVILPRTSMKRHHVKLHLRVFRDFWKLILK